MKLLNPLQHFQGALLMIREKMSRGHKVLPLTKPFKKKVIQLSLLSDFKGEPSTYFYFFPLYQTPIT